MEVLTPAEKFKLVLDLITKIPEFDGNSKNLVDFLDRVDCIIHTVESFEESAKVILVGYVKDKITGKARCQLQRHGRLTTWAEIKEVLKNNFGERMSIEKLIDSIRTARVSTTIEDYYNKINILLSRIYSVYLLANNANEMTQTIESNQRIALQAFKYNLPEPTKSIILSRNPNSLRDAFKIIQELNHQRLGPSTGRNDVGSSYNNSRSNYNSFSRNNNSSRGHKHNRQYNNYNYGGSSGSNYSSTNQNNNGSQNGNSRSNQNNNFNQSGQSRRSFNNNTSGQSRQVNNNANSNQSRNTNRNRQADNHEQMDISLNEQGDTENGRSGNNNQNFQRGRRNNYPI
ncbi:probable serine/threonine-protein kinase clkA [Eupeodes corollae]|uniref:probable serine/threonine-protein kinase clkA n=1 Tax=Eupeodes corollae TaxID=290404 RepID=UPI00248FDEA0|nr:probable serine/threonine-protein kinase clkA [Eupeodes corollae]